MPPSRRPITRHTLPDNVCLALVKDPVKVIMQVLRILTGSFHCLERRVALFGKAHEMSGFAGANALKIMPLIPGLAAAFIVTLSSKLAR